MKSRDAIWSQTPLHVAALTGVGEVSADAELEARDVLGFTALHIAACEGHAEIARRLLAAGAKVDSRTDDGLTPLMLAVAHDHIPIVDALLAAGADANAFASPDSLFPMLSFIARGTSLRSLERLIAAGYRPAEQHYAAYLRLVLELTGHRVRYAERGYSRGIAGETDDLWVVDRPMTVPAALLAPMAASVGLADETRFHPYYAATFAVSPETFDQTEDLDERAYPVVPLLEVAHEVRCGRDGAIAPYGDGWSALARAVTGGNAAIVLALVRSTGLDPG